MRPARRPARADPLSPQQRSAVRRAGGIGLGFVAAGASLVWGLLVAALVLALVRWAIIDLFDDVAWGRRSVVAWIEHLDPGWLAPLVLTLVVLAVALISIGCWLSTRRMRAAGVVGATAVALRGAALGTVL